MFNILGEMGVHLKVYVLDPFTLNPPLSHLSHANLNKLQTLNPTLFVGILYTTEHVSGQ